MKQFIIENCSHEFETLPFKKELKDIFSLIQSRQFEDAKLYSINLIPQLRESEKRALLHIWGNASENTFKEYIHLPGAITFALDYSTIEQFVNLRLKRYNDIQLCIYSKDMSLDDYRKIIDKIDLMNFLTKEIQLFTYEALYLSNDPELKMAQVLTEKCPPFYWNHAIENSFKQSTTHALEFLFHHQVLTPPQKISIRELTIHNIDWLHGHGFDTLGADNKNIYEKLENDFLFSNDIELFKKMVTLNQFNLHSDEFKIFVQNNIKNITPPYYKFILDQGFAFKNPKDAFMDKINETYLISKMASEDYGFLLIHLFEQCKNDLDQKELNSSLYCIAVNGAYLSIMTLPLLEKGAQIELLYKYPRNLKISRENYVQLGELYKKWELKNQLYNSLPINPSDKKTNKI